MKRLATGIIALACGTLVVSAAGVRAQQQAGTPAAAQQQDTRPTIAILDFDVGATIGQDAETYQALRRGLAGMTISELAVNPGVRVVERAQLQQILQEQDLAKSDRVDPASALRVGRLLNARYMVTGTIYDVRGDFRIDARLFNVETSQIIKTQRVAGKLDNVFDLVQRLAADLMRDANLPPLERRVMEEHRQQGAPPTQAVMAYSRAVLYADRGDTQHAVEQFHRALTAFPNYTVAKDQCNRLQAGACS
jgi:TolB-like protein